ncbi:PIR protein [Plasmodium vivax]|uniref:VIR protein n=1 Tax=Plasmodium vivax TaxID=5855 RepID=A0A565A5S2_PLAVI|nr:PIR protein [Plasmodium vivax]
MEKVLGQSDLDKLNTIINYNSFDKDKENCAYYSHITDEKHQLNGEFWEKNISDTLLNALCYVYIKKRSHNLNTETCKYLYYWLGSKVLTNLRHKHFFFEVVHKIYGILNGSELGKICDPVGPNIYNHNFQKFKDIYDLSENYYTYKSHFINPNRSCDQDYDDAINSYKFLYNDLRNKCFIERTHDHEEYCNAFNDYFTEDKHAQISSWTCQLRETAEQVHQLGERHSGDAEKAQIPARTEITVGQKHYRPRLLETGQFVEHLSALHPGVHTGNTVMDRPLDHSDDSSPSTIKKSITSAVSAAGVLVPPFIIYNYAPARSWINKLLGMNKGTNRNPYANQELMADFSMPEDFYSERNRYNIMYNPE